MPSTNLLAQAKDAADIFGRVTPPEGVTRFDQAAGGNDAIGLLVFISTGIRIFTIVAGLFVMLNFFLAGFEYITAGDSKAHAKARERLTTSVIGLVIIVSTYTIIGLIGLIFFGSAGYIINPVITGPTAN